MEFIGCSTGVAPGSPYTNDSSSISVCRRPGQDATTGNENVPKIKKNDIIFFYLKLQSAFIGNFKP